MPSWHRNVLLSWLESSDDVQTAALTLLYGQVLCGLIGSLGPLYTGLVVANILVALFGIIAIASAYQTLGRAYVMFLGCLLLLDVLWFVFFSDAIRKFPPDSPVGTWATFSLTVTFYCEVIGFCLRLLSVLLWIQMYRIGPNSDLSAHHLAVDYEHGLPAGSPLRRDISLSDEVLGTTIYNPESFASLFSSSDPAYFSAEREGSGPVSRSKDEDMSEGGFVSDGLGGWRSDWNETPVTPGSELAQPLITPEKISDRLTGPPVAS